MKFSIEEGTYVSLQLALKALDSAESLRRRASRLRSSEGCGSGSSISGTTLPTTLALTRQQQFDSDEKYASEVVTLTIRIITYCIFNRQQWRYGAAGASDIAGGMIPSTKAMTSYIRKMRLDKSKDQMDFSEDSEWPEFHRSTSIGTSEFGCDAYVPFQNHSTSLRGFMTEDFSRVAFEHDRLPRDYLSRDRESEEGKNKLDTPSTPSTRKRATNSPPPTFDNSERPDISQALSPSLSSSAESPPQATEDHALETGNNETITDSNARLRQETLTSEFNAILSEQRNTHSKPRRLKRGESNFVSLQPRRPKNLTTRSVSAPYPSDHLKSSKERDQEEKEQESILEELADILLRICSQVENLSCRKANFYGNIFHMPPLLSELAMLKGRGEVCLDRLYSGTTASSQGRHVANAGFGSSGRNAPIFEGEFNCVATPYTDDKKLQISVSPFSSVRRSGGYLRSGAVFRRPVTSPIRDITGRIFWEEQCCGEAMEQAFGSPCTASFVSWRNFVKAFERVYGIQPRPVLDRLRDALVPKEEDPMLNEIGGVVEEACSAENDDESDSGALQKLRRLCLSSSRSKRKVQLHRWIRKTIPLHDFDGEEKCTCRVPHETPQNENDTEIQQTKLDTEIDMKDNAIVTIETFAKFCTDHGGLYEGFIAVTDPGTHIECLGSVEDLSKEELRNLTNSVENADDDVDQAAGDSSEAGAGASFVPKPTIIRELLGLKIQQLACGGQHAAVLVEGGAVYTWGKGGFGRLGHGDSRPSASPRRVSISHQCAQVACGFAYTAVVTSCGQVYAWGAGENGRLGVGDEHDRNRPTRVLVRNRVTVDSVYAGSVHTCILTTEGDVYSFGKHEYTGHGSSSDIFVPRKLDFFGSEKISQMSVGPGGYHTIALTRTTGKVFTWGHNRVGQLGFPITDQNADAAEGGYFIPKPTLVKSVSKLNIRKVVAGWGHSAVVTEDGAVYTCGRNFQGQLGLGEPDFSTVNERGHPYQSCFVRVRGDLLEKSVSQFACGGEHSIALTQDGELFAFGKGHKGQLGTTSCDTRYVPTRVERFGSSGRRTMQVACGNNCTLVLRGRYRVPTLFELCRDSIESGICDEKIDAELPPLITSILTLQDETIGNGEGH